MRLCDVRVAATQFTLYMALANAGITISGFLTGPLDKLGGAPALCFGVMGAARIGIGGDSLIRSTGEGAAAEPSPAID